MKKYLFFLLTLITAILIYFVFFFPVIPTATIDHHKFFIEVVKSQHDQEVGLAKYTTLPKNKGMYFVFTHSGYYVFWMKNMHFPIDIIFIRGGKIVTLYTHVPAPTKDQVNLPTYPATVPADAVLEINAGLSQQYNFKVGDSVRINF